MVRLWHRRHRLSGHFVDFAGEDEIAGLLRLFPVKRKVLNGETGQKTMTVFYELGCLV
jgi:hypothetical protein